MGGLPRWRPGVAGAPGTLGNRDSCRSHGPGPPSQVLKAVVVAAPALSEPGSRNPEPRACGSPVAPGLQSPAGAQIDWARLRLLASLPRTVARGAERLGSLGAPFVPQASSWLGAAWEATSVLGPRALGPLFAVAGVDLVVPFGTWWRGTEVKTPRHQKRLGPGVLPSPATLRLELRGTQRL